MIFRRFALLLVASLACVTGLSCSSENKPAMSGDKSSGTSETKAAANVKLAGAGATFPYPLYDQWFNDYRKLHSNVSINYQSIGSGGGVTQFINKTIDFGASDAAMNEKEIAQVEAGVQLVPMTAGMIVLSYNLPGAPEGLKFTRDAYTGIFLGKITQWNDPAIAEANPGAKLPDTKITVVRRADGSGTTYVFTQHLAAVSEDWKKGPGVGKSVDWPVGIGGKGNEGVTATLRQTPGAIGYLEFGYVKQAKLPVALLQNKDGNFVGPETKNGQASLASVELPESLIAWVPDPAGPESYPIVSYTWLLCYKDYSAKPGVANALKDVIRYCLGDGQKISEQMGYLPLPESVTSKGLAALDNIKP